MSTVVHTFLGCAVPLRDCRLFLHRHYHFLLLPTLMYALFYYADVSLLFEPLKDEHSYASLYDAHAMLACPSVTVIVLPCLPVLSARLQCLACYCTRSQPGFCGTPHPTPSPLVPLPVSAIFCHLSVKYWFQTNCHHPATTAKLLVFIYGVFAMRVKTAGTIVPFPKYIYTYKGIWTSLWA